MEDTMSTPHLSTYLEEWNELTKEYEQLEETHKSYLKQLEKAEKLQEQCLKGIKHQKYRMKSIAASFEDAITNRKEEEENKKKMKEILAEMKTRKSSFRELEEYLPHDNGIYLDIILGKVSVALLSKKARFAYKAEYEQFKLVLCVMTLILTFFQLTVTTDYDRPIDHLFHFLLVWYYCTLTIRESILRVNGSRIKGWWMTHHFVSTFLSAVLVTWPDSHSYRQFRGPFISFSFYLSFVQILQYYYQTGQLYRLRTLGRAHHMDITIEGFHSWMWRGLTFLLPFLFGAYIFQFYQSYFLFSLCFSHGRAVEWQVPVVGATFLLLFLCNMYTMLAVLYRKFHALDHHMTRFYLNKYKFFFKTKFIASE